MKLSIFTPTHDITYIDEVYQSLVEQTYDEWEWIIVPNGESSKAIAKTIYDEYFTNDERVKCVVADDSCYINNVANIGALKRFACSHCTGDYLIELDHDDLLTPRALEKILARASRTGADFIYSDFCEFNSDGTCNIYDPTYGWENYTFEYKEHELIAMKAPEVSPRALYQIYYAPNHVRVWKKSFYEKIGGHSNMMEYYNAFSNNKTFIVKNKNDNRISRGLPVLNDIEFTGVCDDHDLLCRTYLNNAKIEAIHEPLYLYRLQDSSNNSYLKYNEEIQFLQEQVGSKYFYQMCEKWSDDKQLFKLDLGDAYNCKEGYLSVDMEGDVHIKCDVTKGIPLPDNSVGCIRAYDFLEHISREGYELTADNTLKKTNPFNNLMNELYRILAPGGWLFTATPIGNTYTYMSDPSHVNPICINTFERYCNKDKQYYNKDLTCRFQDVRLYETGDYVIADLQALKGQKTCGKVNI